MTSRPEKVTNVLLDELVSRGCTIKEVDSISRTPVPTHRGGRTSHRDLALVTGVLYKVCCKCVKWVDYYGYHKDIRAKALVAYNCKVCAIEGSRSSHYSRTKNPEWVAARRLKANKLGQDAKARAVEYKGGVCHDCLTVYPNYVFDFHHLNPEEKEYNPSAALKLIWEEAKKELDKCILVCANCHRERHFGET